MKNLKLVMGLAVLTSFAAHAESKGGLFVEPMLTYENGDSEVDFPSPVGSSDSEYDGFGIGGRLGFHLNEVFFLGADARYSWLDYNNDDTEIETDATAYNFGPVVGIQTKGDLGIRLWASYILDGVMDLDEDRNQDYKFKDASGYRIGGGFNISSVSLNLEYQQINYDKTELEDAGFFSGSTDNVESDNQSLILSVSMPISI